MGVLKSWWCAVSLLGGLTLAVAAERPVSTSTVHCAMCDASAVVALSGDLFAVGNDEDNTLRIYKAKEGGPPVDTLDLSKFLKVDEKFPETDLEGAAWLGDRIFWITSHGAITTANSARAGIGSSRPRCRKPTTP